METTLEGPCLMKYYTDLRLVFQAIDNRQRNYNWLLTDLDCSSIGDDRGDVATLNDQRPLWLTGEALTHLVGRIEMQFNWAVLSGFAPSVSLDLGKLEIEPFADGNPCFWVPRPRIQHPLAEVEIVCWDSSLTMLLTRDREMSDSFRNFFPEAVDLSKYNLARRPK